MKAILSLLILLLVSITVSSQSIDYTVVAAEFTADTMRINQEVKEKVDSNWSTVALIETSIYAEQEYDKLLNKYYKILHSALNEDAKKALEQTQLNWIKLRDSDKNLVSAMRNQIFDDGGGGTIWGVIATDARTDITRRRVIDLYHYFLFNDLSTQ